MRALGDFLKLSEPSPAFLAVSVLCGTVAALVGIADGSGGGNEDGRSPIFCLSHQIQCPLSGFGSPPCGFFPPERGLYAPPVFLRGGKKTKKTTRRTKMRFVKQYALLHKHCLHKHIMNERTVFAQSTQKENIRADCAPPRRMISRSRPRD